MRERETGRGKDTKGKRGRGIGRQSGRAQEANNQG